MPLLDRMADRLSGTTAGARIDGRSPRFWERTSRALYRYINRNLEDVSEVRFLNYGYAPLDDSTLVLEPEDESNRIYIQLYHRVIGGIDLRERDVVEVSSGRGGGARFVQEYFRPRSVCGIDRSMDAVRFCQREHGPHGLRFACGDAQCLPFASASCDAVLNVEASHDYPELARFYAEVHRVLRPGGHFLYTDFRKQEHCPAWREQLQRCGLHIVQSEDITANVARGLELNTNHNAALVRRLAPALLRPLFRQFAGTTGSYVHRSFASGRQRYLRFVLRKD